MRTDRRTGEERRRPITAVVVDDDALVRSALVALLASSGMQVLGEAGDGETAINQVVDQMPDVVVMDLALPVLSGLDTIERIGLLAPGASVLVLTGSDRNQVVEAILAGATGYVVKSAEPDKIVEAVRATARGDTVLDPSIAGGVLNRVREQHARGGEIPGAAAIRALLTERELDIFSRLASGNSNQEIGRALSLSPNTVSNHIASLLAKLQLENRVQAAVQAVRSGIA